MAKTPQAALELIQAVWKPAVAAANADAADFQAMIDAEGGGFKLEAWDWRYYAEKTRKAKYDIDESEVKPYLQLARFREAAFWCANKLYASASPSGATSRSITPDMRTWEVQDASGAAIGLFYVDPYARRGKNSGAWMSEIRSEEQFNGKVLPLVINCTNFSKPAPGEPALLSLDDVHDHLPRVRPRPARAFDPDPLPDRGRHQCFARLCGASFPDQRALGDDAGGAGAVRGPLPDRRSDARGVDRPHHQGQEVQSRLSNRGVFGLRLGRYGHPPGR